MRKILVIPTWYPNTRSSIDGIFIEDQVIALSEIYDVCVVALELTNWKMMLFGRDKIVKGFEMLKGVKVYRYPVFIFPKLFTVSIIMFILRFVIMADKGLVSPWGVPDIIHAHGAFPSGLLGIWLGKKYKVPVVLTEHSGPFIKLFTSIISKHLVSKVISAVDRIIAVSPALAKQINDLYPQKQINIIGNLIRTDIFSVAPHETFRPASKEIQFFSVAIIYETKGFDYLLEAASLLVKDKIDKFKIIIGGDGIYRKQLEKNAVKLGIINKCNFLGMLKRDEVKYWMQQSDVFVMPSLGETFCVALAEAMACGKPVISTRCGGPEYFIDEECGFLVKVADAHDLAEKMAGFILKKYEFNPVTIRSKIEKRFGKTAFLTALSAVFNSL